METSRLDIVGKEQICRECGFCESNGKFCESLNVKNLPEYSGLRITNDGNDCALQVTVDSHNQCFYGCAYCFSENSFSHDSTRNKGLRQTSLRNIEKLFSGDTGNKSINLFRRALRYDNRNAQGFPSPIQLGAINDPCDTNELYQGWLLEFIKLAIKYNQPVRISTKGTALIQKDYLKEISKAPHLFWVLCSIVTPDEEYASKIEFKAPSPKRRIGVIKTLSDMGVFCGLRFRPVIPGASDRTPKYPQAYKTLINWAADAGAKSISYELLYSCMRIHGKQLERWERMEKLIEVPIREIFKRMGKNQASLRPSAAWSEDIVFSIYEEAKKRGLIVGCSEPAWKNLNDDGCCCGMLRTHPVFGNWEPNNACAAIVNARDKGLKITLDSVKPEWADSVKFAGISAQSAGPTCVYMGRHVTYGDKIKSDFYGKNVRNPAYYFQGLVKYLPEEKCFEYVGRQRQFKKAPYWNTK